MAHANAPNGNAGARAAAAGGDLSGATLTFEFPDGLEVTRTLPVYPDVRAANPAASTSTTQQSPAPVPPVPSARASTRQIAWATLRPVRQQRKRGTREVSPIDEEDAGTLGRGKREKRAVRKFEGF